MFRTPRGEEADEEDEEDGLLKSLGRRLRGIFSKVRVALLFCFCLCS